MLFVALQLSEITNVRSYLFLLVVAVTGRTEESPNIEVVVISNPFVVGVLDKCLDLFPSAGFIDRSTPIVGHSKQIVVAELVDVERW